MYKQILYPLVGFFLLGDGGYPCLHHSISIMTPYRDLHLHNDPISSAVRASSSIPLVLKTSWLSIFLRELEIWPLFAYKVIGPCCILQNFCVAPDDILDEEEEEAGPGEDDRGDEVEEEADHRDLSGKCIQARLAA